MRRFAVALITLTLVGMTVTAGASATGNIKDKFTSIGWGGSDGSLPWSGSWEENGDDGDEKEGNVRVVSSGNCASGNCIRIGALTTLLGPIGATRGADTNDLHELELGFDIKAPGSVLGSTLQVQVRDGGEWDTVKTYNLTSSISEHPTIDIDDYRSHDFQLRFRFTSTLLGSEVYIDNVEISGVSEEGEDTTTSTTEPDPTTTTSTTAPTTTTTKPPPTTTTTTGQATTTQPRATTTSEVHRSSTSTTTTVGVPSTSTPSAPGTTTATDDQGDSSTTTTVALAGPGEPTGGAGDGGSGPGPEGSGIRAAARGVQASFQGDLYGEVRTVSSLGGVDLSADYNMAVEVIRASWAWMALLGLVIAWAVISGLDRHPADRAD